MPEICTTAGCHLIISENFFWFFFFYIKKDIVCQCYYGFYLSSKRALPIVKAGNRCGKWFSFRTLTIINTSGEHVILLVYWRRGFEEFEKKQLRFLKKKKKNLGLRKRTWTRHNITQIVSLGLSAIKRIRPHDFWTFFGGKSSLSELLAGTIVLVRIMTVWASSG